MLRSLLYIFIVMVAVAIVATDPYDGSEALLVTAAFSAFVIWLCRRFTDEKEFLTSAFLLALLGRLVFGLIVHNYKLGMFVGPDAGNYDLVGFKIAEYWRGFGDPRDPMLIEAMSLRGPGWGMNYLVAILYTIFGRNFLLAQSFCAVIGAATAPLVYFCSKAIFGNNRAARMAAILVAVFPAFIIWSGQLLKDGLIVFLLVLGILMSLKIQKKFDWRILAVMSLSLFGIMSLRFYIFYMILIAITGTLVFGVNTSIRNLIKRGAVMVVVGVILTFLGAVRTSTVDLQMYGSLERMQQSRAFQASSADSGYGEDEDVSTVGGAAQALPVGFAYLMFAPFPWEVKNLRQSLPLPEVIVWWTMMPLLVIGLWYTVRNRFREAFSVIIFTFLSTISYSIFQGNVGAAYRQRTQIQVFLFIFIGVGWSILMERRHDRKLLEERRIREVAGRRARVLEHSHQV